MNLKKSNGKKWMALMVSAVVTYSVVVCNESQAQTRKPPPPSHSAERRIDLDANIISEFNILNDALEAGVQRNLSIDAKYELIELMKQANALLAATGVSYPQSLPPSQLPLPPAMPAQIMTGERVILDPLRVPNHWWGLDVVTVESADRYGLRLYNPIKRVSASFGRDQVLRTVNHYGGMVVGQAVMITDRNHWWSRNGAEAYIDAIFSNGTFKLKCPRLNAEGMFSFGQFMRI